MEKLKWKLKASIVSVCRLFSLSSEAEPTEITEEEKRPEEGPKCVNAAGKCVASPGAEVLKRGHSGEASQ